MPCRMALADAAGQQLRMDWAPMAAEERNASLLRSMGRSTAAAHRYNAIADPAERTTQLLALLRKTAEQTAHSSVKDSIDRYAREIEGESKLVTYLSVLVAGRQGAVAAGKQQQQVLGARIASTQPRHASHMSLASMACFSFTLMSMLPLTMFPTSCTAHAALVTSAGNKPRYVRSCLGCAVVSSTLAGSCSMHSMAECNSIATAVVACLVDSAALFDSSNSRDHAGDKAQMSPEGGTTRSAVSAISMTDPKLEALAAATRFEALLTYTALALAYNCPLQLSSAGTYAEQVAISTPLQALLAVLLMAHSDPDTCRLLGALLSTSLLTMQ